MNTLCVRQIGNYKWQAAYDDVIKKNPKVFPRIVAIDDTSEWQYFFVLLTENEYNCITICVVKRPISPDKEHLIIKAYNTPECTIISNDRETYLCFETSCQIYRYV